jgi:rRNA maturation endonuclease Nob1
MKKRCKECGQAFREEEFIETETFCEDCGSHRAFMCPNEECNEVYDNVYNHFQNLEDVNDALLQE